MSDSPAAILHNTSGTEIATASNPVRVDPTGTTAQPVSDNGGSITIDASSLPLPTGAATAAKQPAIGTAGTPSADVISVQGVSGGTPQPVSGTFWQTTQPVSAASLPLPAGAATETTLSGMSGKLPATLGQKAMAASMSVVVASDQTAVPISAAALPLPSGAATSALQTTGNTSLGNIDTKTPALGQTTMANSQPVTIASNQSAVPVSGPLTDTQLRATAVPVSDGGGSLTVDGPLTDTQLRATAVPVSAASLPLPAGAATSALQTTGNTSVGSIDTKTPALGQAAMAASTPVAIASNQSAVPISAATLPLPTGAATETTLSTMNGKLPTLGQKTMAGSQPVVVASDQGAVPVSAASLPLPAGAATAALQTTGNSSLSSIDGKLPTVGQKTMAGSQPVVIASDQGAIPITGSISATNPSVGTDAAAKPASDTLVGGSDGTNLQAARVFDVDSGAGSQFVLGASLRKSASGGSVELGTATDPVFVEEACDTPATTNVAASASNVTLLAANTSRRGAAIYNDSVATLYVKLGTTASTTSFTIALGRYDYYEVPSGYRGRIDGIWSAAVGAARITELT